MRLAQASHDRRIQEIAAQLTRIFDTLPGETLRTPVGFIRWQRRDDGTFDLLITSSHESP